MTIAGRGQEKQRSAAGFSKSDWLIPAGLLFLSLAPLIGGTVRLGELSVGAEITPANARFFAAPVPIIIHAISSLIYFILGAFQFSPGVRRRWPHWHRMAGRVLVPSGLLCALSGMWMAQVYPPFIGDGTALYLIRLAVGTAMVVFICFGVAAIRRRDIASHRPWMMRAYALAIAAGTQAFTLAPLFIFPSLYNEIGWTTAMAAGWLINAAVVEWFIWQQSGTLRLRLHAT